MRGGRAVSGLTPDSQLSLGAFWGHLSKIDGLVATYDSSVSDAALKDTFGNGLGPEIAQWLRPVVPFILLTPGVAFSPPCSIQCRQVILPNGVACSLYSRWYAGFGAIESLVVDDDGQSAPAGSALTDGFNSYGETDQFGYVIVTPVPANGTGTYELSEA